MSPQDDSSSLYPYRLKPVIKEKVWGGRNLDKVLGKTLPPKLLIGETWEAWEGCIIENGAFSGKPFSAAIDSDPKGVLGAAFAATRQFPLLFKFIDAQQDLSVQVHPDDAEAQQYENQPRGKTEAWYILHADPGARLILGFNRGMEPEEVLWSLKADKLTDFLSSVPVRKGDVLFCPAGTVHAIGKGIVLAEIQENSDITYRLYDWGRVGPDRPLHIDESLRVLDFNRISNPRIPMVPAYYPDYDRRFLVACRYFVLESLDVRRRTRALEMTKFQILTAIQGSASILYGDHYEQRVEATRGHTIILPAMLGPYVLEPREKPCVLLRAFVPDLMEDVIVPLRRAGNDIASIQKLGGPAPEHNDLLPLVQE